MSANDKLAATFGPGRTTPTPTLETRIAVAVGRVVTNVSNWPDAVAPHLLGRDLAEPINMITEALAPVIAEAQAEALESEARNLRELHTLIEDTPWNPMPAEDKARCVNFMAESGVDDHEYTNRHLNNYAAWLDRRAEQIRSNDE